MVLLLLVGSLLTPARTAEAAPESIKSRLEARIEANPDDATAWRLLGRLQLDGGDPATALESLRRAAALDRLSAAAAFDLSRAYLALDRRDEALAELQRVVELAPGSDYARQAAAVLEEAPHPTGEGVVQAGYEIRRFDGTERIEDQLPLQEKVARSFLSDYFYSVEVGGQYNSNVGLTPLSRDLFSGNRGSFQAIVSPAIEANLFERDALRIGTGFDGDFTLNEGGFNNFNLQSYRPGAFVEWDAAYGGTMVIPRIDYQFGLDQFDTRTFATRHQVTSSVIAVWSRDSITMGYWAIDHTDFRNDGLVPWITSRDGITNAIGFSHEIRPRCRWVRTARTGMQVDHADTDGADFRYYGVELNGGVTFEVTEAVEVELRGGWGYRDYPDFLTGPARNEHIVSAGAELRREITESVSVATVFAYDRFFSDNALYDADRAIGGLLLSFEK